MIKKLLMLKNVIKNSSEKRLLDILIREASAERSSFTSEILGGSSVPDYLVNALVFKIKSILPEILGAFYPEKKEEKIKDYVYNNATVILFQEIEAPEDEGTGREMSILDHYLSRSSDDYPSEEEYEFDISYPTIDVDAEPQSRDGGPLRLMPQQEEPIPQYDETISEEILKDLLYTFVEQSDPLGPIYSEDSGESLDEDEDEDDVSLHERVKS